MNTQTQNQTHTALPWHLSHQLGDGFSIAPEIAPNCGRLVCVATAHNAGGWNGNRLDDETARANAALIVRAVNSHGVLVSALTLAQKCISDHYPDSVMAGECMDEICAALKLATEGK